MGTFAAWPGQNPPFEHHKSEGTEEEGTESARAKRMQTLCNTNNIIIEALQRENNVTSLSSGYEQNHHNGFLATLKQSSNCNKETKQIKECLVKNTEEY